MNSLLKAELLRVVSRRLLVVLLVCMAGVAAFGAAVDASYARPLTGQDQRQALENLKQDKLSWEEACGENGVASDCDGWDPPSSVNDYLRTPTSFGDYVNGVISFGAPLMLLAVSLLAAVAVGSEFSSGNIGTQLLFTPGRVSVLVAKVVAASLAGVVVALAYLGTAVAFCALMFLSLRGAHDMTAGIELPLMLGRLALLAVMIAVMTAAISMASGSTLIPVGVLAVVLVGSYTLQNTISGWSVVQLFLPGNILDAMIAGKAEIYGWRDVADYQNWELAQVIHYDWALGYSVVGTVLIVVAAAWWFRRRDITH